MGFDATGRILAMDAIMAADAGHSLDMTGGVIFRAITHALNCCDVPALSVRALACKTNTVSNTAFRGFGGPQGLLLMEDVVHRVGQIARPAAGGSRARAISPAARTMPRRPMGRSWKAT